MSDLVDPTEIDTSAASTANGRRVPEFRIVVRSSDRRGPLAPYRLLIAVAVTGVVLGPTLWSMLRGGSPDDMILLRAAGIGVLVWITTGVVSRALADASARLDADR